MIRSLDQAVTLIACEHLKECVGIELDEGYVKTAVARWEEIDGFSQAVLIIRRETSNHNEPHGEIRKVSGALASWGKYG